MSLPLVDPWEVKKDEFEHDDKRIVVYDFDKSFHKPSSTSLRKSPICSEQLSSSGPMSFLPKLKI